MLPYLLNFGILPFAHLINRLAKASLNFSIPNHMLFQKFPDYTFLKTFGCACFPLLRPYNNHKLDFRSTECLFLGYSTSHKGYKCMSSSSRITSLRISFSMNPSFPMLTCLRLLLLSINPLPLHSFSIYFHSYHSVSKSLKSYF